SKPTNPAACFARCFRFLVVIFFMFRPTLSAPVIIDREQGMFHVLRGSCSEIRRRQLAHAFVAVEPHLRLPTHYRSAQQALDEDTVNFGIISVIFRSNRDGQHQNGSLKNPLASISPGSAS